MHVVLQWTRRENLSWQRWGRVGLALTGIPFSLVRKTLPFTGTWGPFCGTA